MFLILLKYKKSITEIDAHLVPHREFLQKCYDEDCFIVSGPQNPRTGGVLISQLTDRTQLENILKLDPFAINGLADYEIIEFTPVKYHKNFAAFIQ